MSEFSVTTGKNKVKSFTCVEKTCDKTFASLTELNKHKKSHDTTLLHKCDQCDAVFREKTDLTKHSVIHDFQRPIYKCQTEGCAKKYKSKSALRNHERKHSGSRPYVCEVETCKATFTVPQALKAHSRTHLTEKPYKCPIAGCAATFTQPGHLSRHLRTHTGERPYACKVPECESTFASSSELDLHTRVHNGEKPYKCDFQDCGYECTQNPHLIAHKRSHTGEKPYKCTYENCDSDFSVCSSLTKHINTVHLKLKPFHCTYFDCEFACSDGQSLKAHIRVHHTLETPYKCEGPMCDKAFKLLFAYKQHYYYHHTREGNVRLKKEEARILSFLKKNSIDFVEQHFISFVCIGPGRDGDRCFIDYLIEVKDKNNCTIGFILLEVDEHQHCDRTVSCELRRMTDVGQTLQLDGNTFPIMFIRYNPNAYKVDHKTVTKSKHDRESMLLKFIQEIDFTQPLAVTYMFYDTVDKQPAVFSDPEYAEAFKTLVTGNIF